MEQPPKPGPRSPILAAGMNVVCPGLGYLYLGRAGTGFALAVVYQLVPPLFLMLWSYARFDVRAIFVMMATLGPVEQRVPAIAILPLAFAAHAFFLGRKVANDPPKPWQRPLGYGTFFLVTSMTGFILAGWVQDTFARRVVMPTGALEPTIRNGDMVFLLKTKQARLPKPGAFAAFAPLQDFKPPLFVRVVAEEGAVVAIDDGGITLDGGMLPDSAGGAALAQTTLKPGQYVGLATARDVDAGQLDSRDVGILHAGDYYGQVGVVAFTRDSPEATPRYVGTWFVPR